MDPGTDDEVLEGFAPTWGLDFLTPRPQLTELTADQRRMWFLVGFLTTIGFAIVSGVLTALAITDSDSPMIGLSFFITVPSAYIIASIIALAIAMAVERKQGIACVAATKWGVAATPATFVLAPLLVSIGSAVI